MAELVTNQNNTQRTVSHTGPETELSGAQSDSPSPSPSRSSSSCRDAEGSRWPVHYREQTVLFNLVQTWRRASPDSICDRQGVAWQIQGFGKCVYILIDGGCWRACWTNISGDQSGMEWKWPAITWVQLYFGVYCEWGQCHTQRGCVETTSANNYKAAKLL